MLGRKLGNEAQVLVVDAHKGAFDFGQRHIARYLAKAHAGTHHHDLATARVDADGCVVVDAPDDLHVLLLFPCVPS